MKIFSKHRVKNISKFDFSNTNEHLLHFINSIIQIFIVMFHIIIIN